jgi:hypothetical protein
VETTVRRRAGPDAARHAPAEIEEQLAQHAARWRELGRHREGGRAEVDC